MLTFRETGCPVQLSYVLFLSLDLCGLQTHISPSAFDLLPHVVLLFPAVALGYMATVVTLITTWCSKGAQGSPPGRYPACSSSGYTDLVFVDLENAGDSCKLFPIAPKEPFSPHPRWYATALSLGPVFSPLLLLFLVSSSWLSIFHWQLDCREKFLSWLPPPTQGIPIFLRRETLVLLDPGQGSHIATGTVPGGPWHCCLATGAGILHDQCWWGAVSSTWLHLLTTTHQISDAARLHEHSDLPSIWKSPTNP